MAIGDVRAGGGLKTQLVSDQSGEITSRAWSGLGESINRLAQTGLGYLNSRTEIEAIYDKRAMASEGLELETQFLQYQQDRATEFTEFSRDRSSSPGGMTRDYDAQLAKNEEAFLATVPERHREEYRAKLARDRAQRVGSAFASELSLMDTADTNTLNTGLNTIGSALKGKTISLEDAGAQWEEMVGNSMLPAETKQQFIERGKATLEGLEFGTIVEEGAKGYGAVNDGTTGDVAAAGMSPAQRGVLNGISSREAKSYNVWNGGQTFDSYADHPAATQEKPGKSTAAGKYQFLYGTWRAATASYERTYGVRVPDFSPEWQDRVALHWAEKRFNELNGKGLTFQGVLAGGDPQQMLLIRDVLGKPRGGNPNAVEWEGLGHMTDAEFLETLTGQKGIAGGGTGPASMPNVWTDPRFSNVSLDQKLGFANAAAQAAETQKAAAADQIKLERQKFQDAVYNAGYSGDASAAEAFKTSHYWDAEAQAKFNAGMEVYRKSESDSFNVGSALAAGSAIASSQIKAFGKWFGNASFQGIAQGDEAAYEKMRYAVNNGKLFPEGSVDAFRTAMGNPETAGAALAFLASAHMGDSSILDRSGFSNKDIADVALYAGIAGRAGSAETAYQDYLKATTAKDRMGMTEGQLQKAASEAFSEAYPSSADVVKHFDGWFTQTPDAVSNPNTEGMLMLDAQTAFQDGYLIYGSKEGAEQYMLAFLDRTWGVSEVQRTHPMGPWFGEITQPVLMKYPPEKYYSDENRDASILYDGLADFAVAGGALATDALMMADGQTDQEIKSGKLPTYKVIGKGEYGEAILLPGRFGGQELRDGIDSGITQRGLKANALNMMDQLNQRREKLGSQIKTLELMGGTPEELEALRSQEATLTQGSKAALIAAFEQDQLSPDVPTDPTDPSLDAYSKTILETMMIDPTAKRKINKLTAEAGGTAEARMSAMAKVVQDTYGTTNEVAQVLVQKMLEQ